MQRLPLTTDFLRCMRWRRKSDDGPQKRVWSGKRENVNRDLEWMTLLADGDYLAAGQMLSLASSSSSSSSTFEREEGEGRGKEEEVRRRNNHRQGSGASRRKKTLQSLGRIALLIADT